MGVPRNGFVGCFETTMLMSTVSFLLKSFSYVSTEKCLKRDSHSPRSTDSHRSSCSDCRTHCKQNEVCLCLSVARSISLSVSLPLSVSVSVSVCLCFYLPHIICLYGSLCLSVSPYVSRLCLSLSISRTLTFFGYIYVCLYFLCHDVHCYLKSQSSFLCVCDCPSVFLSSSFCLSVMPTSHFPHIQASEGERLFFFE